MANLPPEKHTRILRKGNKKQVKKFYELSWAKWYYGFIIGFLWGIMIFWLAITVMENL